MTAYLGPVGGLVPFKCPSSVEITPARPSTFKESMGGRVVQFRGLKSRRSWSVGIGTATPGELAGLMALEHGGKPPFVFVEPFAQVTNLLHPEQSLLMPGTYSGAGVTEGGAVTAGGAMAPRSVLHASGGTVDFGFRAGVADRPVVFPGVPVSASVYVRGTGVLALSWRDWSGSDISTTTVSYNNPSMGRAVITNRIPPAGAASVRFYITGMRHAAMPALTWTQDAAEWSTGRGCNRAVVEGLSEAVQLASREDAFMRRSSLTFTIREVG